ncbi:MAG: PH domain-containing protein [Dokdonella sp.]|nr:PH domain-containing protein [Dokdonella sp.]
MPIVHPSKIDAWLAVVLATAMLGALVAAIMALAVPSPVAWAISAFTAIVGIGLPLWLLLSTRYTLARGELLVQSGPFRWRITVADITGIVPTSNPLSSPALSLDRLRIEYGPGRSLMISPRDKERFMRDVEAARRGAARSSPAR